MLLGAAGDSLGYRGGRWEYCESGETIRQELTALGGLERVETRPPEWRVSDDTVLHLATGQGLVTGKSGEDLLQELAGQYVEAMKDMEDRKPGPSSILGTSQLRPGEKGGYRIPFNPDALGCGAAMRSMCIGLRYPRECELAELIRVSVESGRMTHHHPTGYLGALTSALFTALAVQGKPLHDWGPSLLETLPLAREFVRGVGVDIGPNLDNWEFFTEKWRWYLERRGLLPGGTGQRVRSPASPAARDSEYRTLSIAGWAGRSGHDAPMIAFDALMEAGDSWSELCNRAMFHGGDSDSTGVIAGSWFGIIHGLSSVPAANHEFLEYRERLLDVADGLYKMAWGEGEVAVGE